MTGPTKLERFVMVRDYAVEVARLATVLESEVIDEAIRAGDDALALGPVFDPTMYRAGADELRKQLRVMRALRDFRAAVVVLSENSAGRDGARGGGG